MRSFPVESTMIYRWLYTNTAPSGAVSQSARGPYMRKQNVNHFVPKGFSVIAELQKLEAVMNELRWVTIKTLELEN